jgi:hypothetical protein
MRWVHHWWKESNPLIGEAYMSLSDLLGVLEQYRGATAASPPPNVEEHFSQVAQSAPQEHIAGGLADAFKSNETPPFAQMLGTLFSNSNGQQRAGILNQLLGAAGSGAVTSGALGGLAGLLGGGNTVSAEQANQVPPEAVQQLAEHAQRQDPSIIEKASQFYAQHPTVVQTLGAGALALVMSHLSQRQ